MYGLGDNLSLISSYFADRGQVVNIKGKKSAPVNITSGLNYSEVLY